MTYKEFNFKVNQACRLLESAGIGVGDVYNLHLPNSPAFLILWFAGARLGAVMMPTNVQSSQLEMEYLLEHSGSRISFTTSEYWSVLESCHGSVDCLSDVRLSDPYTDNPFPDSFENCLGAYDGSPYSGCVEPDALAAIMYTSGTTSRPKGVMVTHANYLKAGATVANSLNLTDSDRHFVVLPLFHGNAQYYSTMSAILRGASIALMDRFSASQYFDRCIEYRCTVASLFAAPIRMLLVQAEQKRHRRNHLRSVIYAQNITVGQELDWHRRFDAPLSQLWGMTETMGPPLMNPVEGERRNRSMGKPVGGYIVKLLDADGKEVGPGEQGEIVVGGVAGKTIMNGYFRNPEATSQTIRNGWLYTGDIAQMDNDGYFYFIDRSKDMIKRAGENISAGEVESVLQQHPAVFECAVIGIEDGMHDEKIVAVVVQATKTQASETDLIEHCKKYLASFRVPQIIVFRKSLPKTSVGKIQKHLLKREIV